MGIDKAIKKKVIEDWLHAFPQLSMYTQNKLYKIVGACIIGIELIKLPHSENYRPHFVIYPLWKSNAKECLDAPIIIKQIYNKKRLQFNIPYNEDTIYFNEAIECLRNQIAVSLSGEVTLKSLFEFIDIQMEDMLVKIHSAKQANLFELKLLIALYSNNKSLVQSILHDIQHSSKNWDIELFEVWHGKFDLWLQGLNEKIKNQEEFIIQIETNKQDKKISQLKSSELLA